MTLRGPISALRAFARPPRAQLESPVPSERCDACAAPVGALHDHVLDEAEGELRCACEACAVASPVELRVRRGVRRLALRAPSASAWAALGVPIELAFFFVARGPKPRLVARYPSAAGAVEAALADDALAELSAVVPDAAELSAGVESILIHRGRDAVYRVSIDVAFELVARLRGARDVAAALSSFFDALDAEAAFA